MNSCRICNKRQISRTADNVPQFDIRKAIQRNNSAIFGAPYSVESEFNFRSLHEYLLTAHIDADELLQFEDHLREEEYDSESLMMDIIEENPSDSNNHQFLVDSPAMNDSYQLIKKFLLYDRFPAYKQGDFIRYLVLSPKYYSLVKEICLNNVHPLSIDDWENKALDDVKRQYHKKTLFSTVTDERYGIEEGEPIGIHHLIVIYLFTEPHFEKYRRNFSKSHWLWDEEAIQNNDDLMSDHFKKLGFICTETMT